MEKLFLYHHIGLGDYFICNGLVNHILDTYNPKVIFLPTKFHNITTVNDLYSYEKKIIPVGIPGGNSLNEEISQIQNLVSFKISDSFLQIGFSKARIHDWDVSFYDTNNVPFEYRWSKFKIKRNNERENILKNIVNPNNEKFVLVHNTGSTGKHDLKINTNLKIIYVEPITSSMLDWCGLLNDAEQVHCIDSSFLHLAQSLQIKQGIFHNIRKSSCGLKNTWGIVDYDDDISNTFWEIK